MDTGQRDRFIRLWHEFFPGAELPITFELTSDDRGVERAPDPKGWRCVVCDLARVRKGRSLVFSQDSLSCSGARYYLGYVEERGPDFRHFLSSGKPGSVRGERYKRTPEIVDEFTNQGIFLPATGRSYLFRRWDHLAVDDHPDVVIFFSRPEVISGLFTLANFDRADPHGVICPFGSGCSSIIHYPRLEAVENAPRAILGMCDPSARPCVPVDMMTMAIPMRIFGSMIDSMEESFLVTETWEKVKRKIEHSVRRDNE
ncbi:MAG: DUF169 domain-containing protein [Methanolinea sp.]|jgi:uncharacterized protein (DUF169 family)|nr:DUF169 domain-containing protein [Methanolinea sp.]